MFDASFHPVPTSICTTKLTLLGGKNAKSIVAKHFYFLTGGCKSATGWWVLHVSDLATWSQIRLSDRMAVDLIEKMKTLGILGDTLLHTTNGKEYITTERLVDDIYECLEDQGGRVSVVDLPGFLGIDYSHCNAQAQVLLQVSSYLESL